MIAIELDVDASGVCNVRALRQSEPFHAALRNMPGMRWHKPTRSYRGPVEAAEAALAPLQDGGFVKVVRRHVAPSRPEQGLERILERLDDARALQRRTEAPETPPVKGYQIDGCRFLRASLARFGAGVLGDEPGLGKTAQTILALADRERVLVVCPAIVKWQWREEICRWHPLAGAPTCLVLDNGEHVRSLMAAGWGRRGRYMWVIVSYGLFSHITREFVQSADAVVFDELHYLMNYRSKRGEHASKLLKRSESKKWKS